MAEAPVSKGMSETPLPAPPPPDADVLRMIDLMLDQQPVPPDLAERCARASVARAAETEQYRQDDWPGLGRYRRANAEVRNPDLVMIGDSITEIWGHALPDMFDETIVNRGISGQTSAQILLRFVPDVVELRPKRVHILCGTNDIAGNTGPNVPRDFQANIRAMADLATANDIEVLIGSIPPAAQIFWQPDSEPRKWVPFLNDWLRDFCTQRGLGYVDYHSILTNGEAGLRADYSADGVHVTRLAYREMQRLLGIHLTAERRVR